MHRMFVCTFFTFKFYFKIFIYIYVKCILIYFFLNKVNVNVYNVNRQYMLVQYCIFLYYKKFFSYFIIENIIRMK